MKQDPKWSEKISLLVRAKYISSQSLISLNVQKIFLKLALFVKPNKTMNLKIDCK